MFSKIKLFVFDIDGTLMDSIGRIIECMQTAAQNTGFSIKSPQEIKNIIGITLRQAVATLYPNEAEQNIDIITNEYRRLYNLWDVERPTSLFLGVEDTLELLKSKGYKLAIATGKSKNGLQNFYKNERLNKLFDFGVTGDMAKSKPNPDMLLQILLKLNISAEETVMVGDSNLDLQMGKNALVSTIGVTCGVHSFEVLQKEKPMLILENVKDIVKYL